MKTSHDLGGGYVGEALFESTRNSDKNWYKIKSKVQSFQYKDDPELIHIIKTGSPNTYILVYEDGYQLDTGKTEILTKEKIERRFNITLAI